MSSKVALFSLPSSSLCPLPFPSFLIYDVLIYSAYFEYLCNNIESIKLLWTVFVTERYTDQEKEKTEVETYSNAQTIPAVLSLAFFRCHCDVHGWPSGLRRQTQAIAWYEFSTCIVSEPSGTRKGAWVRTPLRANVLEMSLDWREVWEMEKLLFIVVDPIYELFKKN